MIVLIIFLKCDPNYGQATPAYLPFANPVSIYGTDFLRIFQQYYKQGNWDMMMKLTSQESVKHYGYNKILFYYNEMDFGYVIRLKSIKKTDSGIEMNYSANIQATQIVIRCFVVVENDTCRLLLGNNFMRSQYFLK
ncbi:MAG: hypothetical protein IPM91_02250 [Bacteroidetes bacterium]|nr:hypothetical protein [Bacteroidota bacterium]